MINEIVQLWLAVFLGCLLGLEREMKKRPAGFQTYSLVSLAAFIFSKLDLAQFVPVGIGFLGAGVIFKKEEKIEGLTTAAGLWLAAAIGVAVGLKKYFLAIFATISGLFILIFFEILERKLTFKK